MSEVVEGDGMAIATIEAIRTMQPNALPVFVTVDIKAKKVRVRVGKELEPATKSRVLSVTGSLPVEFTIEADLWSKDA